jgi:alpha-tubulin suppressor-like RCC1 family protein
MQHGQISKNDQLFLFDPNVWIPLLPAPQKVEFSRNVKHSACGGFHTMILTDEGQIFGCGLALNGRLGLEAPIIS